MDKLKNFFFSTRLTGVLFLVYAASMGIATFIENDYGTQASKALVYNTWWFELIHLVFIVNFTGNIFRYRLYRKEKWSVLIFHLAFILILIGAGITRYISYEAMMPIQEGEATDKMLSETTYFNVVVDNNEVQKTYERTYLFAPEIKEGNRFISAMSKFLDAVRGGNDFSIKDNFKGKDFTIDYVDYIPNAYEAFIENEEGDTYLHFVESGNGTRHDHYIKKGDIANVHNVLVAFDKETEGAVNIFSKNDSLFINTPQAGSFMIMATQRRGAVKKDTIQPFNLRSLYNLAGMQFVVPTLPLKGEMDIVSGDKDEHPSDMVAVQVTSGDAKQKVTLFGQKYLYQPPQQLSLNGLNFRISYGARQLQLPFSVRLRDFQLERYPGSNSPKSFASEVTVIDKDETFDFRIFMNNILNHKGFKFFQSSYDDTGAVEETHLSVNHDAVGTTITYMGYVLLFFAMTFILFSGTTRFADLKKMLDKVKEKKKALTAIFLMLSLAGFGQDHFTDTQIDSILQANVVPQAHAERFSELVIQDEGGRMKPVHTFSSELLRKVHKKDNYKGLDASQIVVAMATNPRMWLSAPIIYMDKNNTRAREMLGVPLEKKYLSLTDLLTPRGEYKLSEDLEKAYKKRIKSKYDQSIVSVHERASLLYGVVFGGIFRFFPLQGDENNKWHAYVEHKTAGYKGTDSLYVANILPLYAGALHEGKKSGDYSNANEYLESIHKYQQKFGAEVLPDQRKINLEIFYNKYDIFRSLYKYYIVVGVLMLIFLIIQIFNDGKIIHFTVNLFKWVVILLFIYHLIGLGIRWYISGHVPWSNGYESMIYVAWATMFFGLAFGRKSNLTIAASAFVVGVILFFAHKNWMDPAIANLVPVLDSYWVMIHVSIIVASYGPLTLSMILGLIALILFALTSKKNKKKINLQIKEITIISEMSMTVGLVMLTIGNFLGAMWANESWGRYWGWDPKETWALINIMLYAFILHMRLIPGLRGRFVFNMLAFFAFASILMGYLGVNHLLSGLHSYAAGESAPIPYQIWTWLAIGIVVSLLAYLKNKKYYKK